MKRISLRYPQAFAFLVVGSLQLCLFVWQHQHLSCVNEREIANDFIRSPKAAQVSLVEGKPSIRREAFRLPDGLPLAPDHIRAFPVLQNEFPCFPAEPSWNSLRVQKSPATRGFLYVKARKASSSTVAGVAIRIARKIARERHLSSEVCQIRFNHPMASKLQYSKRDKAQSFLWSILREPSRRFISEFFHFGLSRKSIQPTDKNIIKYMKETIPPIDNYYLRWLSVESPFDFDKDSNNIPEFVRSIIHEYDYIGISERLTESLVALQMILDLETSDMLFLSAKVNGGWDDGVYGNQCYFIASSFVSPSMQKYFETSEEWRNFSLGDDLLYRAANASLDKTIASFDRRTFDENVQRLDWALQKAKEVCTHNVTFPCSEAGELNPTNDCLMWDSACGMDCLDKVSADFLS